MLFKRKNIKNLEKMDEDNFLFVRYVYGFKEVPYNIFGLIVNNKVDEKVSLYYLDNDKVKEMSVPKKNIREKSYSVRIRSSEYKKTIENKDNKYKVLSEVEINHTSLSKLLDEYTFNKLFDKMQKIPFYSSNLEFEITMRYSIRGKVRTIVFTSYKDPKHFIDKIKVYDKEEIKVKEKSKKIEKKNVKKDESKSKQRALRFKNKVKSKK